MLIRAARLALGLGRWRAILGLRHARAQAGLGALFILFALAFAGFGVALLLVLLASRIGVVAALGLAMGMAGLLMLAVGLALWAERQAYARRQAEARRAREQFLQTALLALEAGRGSGLALAGLGVLALILLGRSGGDPPQT